jgi:hypothetical protein
MTTLRVVPQDPDPREFPPRRWACHGCPGDRADCLVEACGEFHVVPPPTLPPDGTPGAAPLLIAA